MAWKRMDERKIGMTEGFCPGFRAGAVEAAIKSKGRLDLGLVVSDTPAAAAGVFTRNRVAAAPVRLDRERLRSGRCQAVLVNSGNANCCTGGVGMRDAAAMSRAAAEALFLPEELVCVGSTGVIGQPLPMDRIVGAVPELVRRLRPDGLEDFARAILTTDLATKTATASGVADGVSFVVTGVAKGSGMIRPDMATMLCYVFSDAVAAPETLRHALRTATEATFNRITVDGDTSTNDTVLLLANGVSGARVDDGAGRAAFEAALHSVMDTLARMVVRDGEGATKLCDVTVRGALSDADARAVADAVAHSSLVKTALFGEDANWGRIIAAAGRAGVPLLPERIAISFDDVRMVERGAGLGPEAEARATEVLKTPEFTIAIDLGLGDGRASVLTCDFSYDYVRINADYRT
jgi:glutamate N-acetyltransferase / amino-acid N-acetyltransferase